MKNFLELKLPLHFSKNIAMNTGTILDFDLFPLEFRFAQIMYLGYIIGNLYKEITSQLVFYVADGMKSTVARYVRTF